MKAKNTTLAATLSISCLRDELIRRGYTFDFQGPPYRRAVFTAPNGWLWETSPWFVEYPFVTARAVEIAKDKWEAAECAQKQGLAVLPTLQCDSSSVEAVEFMRTNAPVVVKPLDNAGSRGVTLNISDAAELTKGIEYAQHYSKTVLIQKQFYGEELRFTVIEGRVVTVQHRQPAQVIGDGKTSVKTLITRENAFRADMKKSKLTYPQLDEKLVSAELLNSENVPARGETVALSDNALVRCGASVIDVTAATHQTYIDAVEKLASAISPSFLTIDLMVVDYRDPMTEDNHAFIECNTAPSLLLYYAERNGNNYDIVNRLANMVDDMSKSADVVGCFEVVSLPEFGVKSEMAKIDTGAYSGALHCTDIKVVRRGILRKRILQFKPLGDRKRATETDKFIKTFIRSTTGHRIKRYIIDTTIELQGKTYPIRIGLADRSDLKRNVLIGRRFLRDNNLLVDVRINQEHDDEGEASR